MSTASSVWRLGPVKLFGSYSWQASVDRATGQAFALELSQINSANRGKNEKQQQQNHSLLKQVLGEYPTWLCRGSVTLGLLQAQRQPDGGTCLQTRLLGLNILTFGKPVGQKIVLHSTRVREEAIQWKYPILGGILTATQPAGELVVALKSGTSDKNAAVSSAVMTLDTQLVAYRPRVVGVHTPTNPVRIGLYLGTQSVVHGYAMWRFHRHVRQQLMGKK